MEEDFPESSLDGDVRCSRTGDLSPQDLNVDSHQDPEQDSEQLGLQDVVEHKTSDPDPPEDQLRGEEVDPNASGEGFGYKNISVLDQNLLQAERDRDQDQDQNQDLRPDPDRVSPYNTEHKDHTGPDQDRDRDRDRDLDRDRDRDRERDQDQDQQADEECLRESGGSVPELVITQAEESLRPASVKPSEAQRPAELEFPVTSSDPSLSPSSDGDMTCSDLLSLRSDSLSLASETTVSRMSEEDDSRSVTTSSVMSLFHRVQLDPLEKLWWRNSALGNMAAQRQLLAQEPSLVLKKDFVSTALHWAAKQGRQEALDMMLRSGADVNVRSGYTALHLASIHGHQHIITALINTHNANSSIRDYHGKTAVHYWSGCSSAFNKPDTPSGGMFSRGRRTQRYALPSLLLTRSRSHGQLNLEFGTFQQSASHDALDIQV